jgi:hypothetical protein
VLINSEGDIIYITGKTGKYLGLAEKIRFQQVFCFYLVLETKKVEIKN